MLNLWYVGYDWNAKMLIDSSFNQSLCVFNGKIYAIVLLLIDNRYVRIIILFSTWKYQAATKISSGLYDVMEVFLMHNSMVLKEDHIFNQSFYE